ncbi:NADH-quinone oxidoreductase subunit L [Candidatus Erwinia haradaeae]|uniref:NADH-quinone oxidoreductase subunit L n=1 Tax=Candidatus Erwinia haradaeae TaxID=1922217 RepID=A0A451DG87_9GAMM|nr:NADH-quinone oxidoreductase subunit L [Candidatus Erwinia haradaeae]VFP85643.1 NADH-quinone oxidoreductase subunit L [Candidatus Erwinia haradaeae]
MNLLYFTILCPLMGFLCLACSSGRISETLSSVISFISIGLTILITGYIGYDFLRSNQEVFNQTLWTWIDIEILRVDVGLMLDGLSLTLLAIVTGVGFLINMFASWYMRGAEGYSRFFAYINLFIASMLVLILADNLALMYLGWEGVGLCSYLLIGFYYTNPEYGAAAIKAFIITRVGDVCFFIALLMLYSVTHTLNFHNIGELVAEDAYFKHLHILPWITLMLLVGAVGKSAQLPLQTWLADAMVGPTPVSALIHAATMVTAGVYLIARTHVLFLLTPSILYLVGVIGAMTILLAGLSALVQTDIKRVLAYSTMSQLGYMFLALGVQAWQPAIFHLMTHAFFKALLFLSAASLIIACNHEQNMFKMGGLRLRIPLIYSCFIIGGASLMAFPIITSGFFSKESILVAALDHGYIMLMLAGLIGSLITSLYTCRMIFLIFHGRLKNLYAQISPNFMYYIPLIILSLLSSVVGSLFFPPLQGVFPESSLLINDHLFFLKITSSVIVMIGCVISAVLWLGPSAYLENIACSKLGRFLRIWWLSGWGFDWLYHKVFIQTYLKVAKVLSSDPLAMAINSLAYVVHSSSKGLMISESSYVRWHVAVMSYGAVFLLALIMVR